MAAFTPTAEQDAIREAFATGEDLAVTALAGSGKTSTLQLLAQDHPRKFMTYCAFNKSIAAEAARKFPATVASRTVHSFAFRAVGKDYTDRLNGPRVPAWKVADILDLPERWQFGEFSLRAKQLARLVTEGISRFCHSASPLPEPYHVPAVPGLDSDAARSALTELLHPYLLRAWEDLTRRHGKLRFTHDCYLKIWAHQSPSLPGDVVLADEAQDLDPLILHIINQQNAQRVFVGDSFQSIYEWRGAVDALSRVQVAHTLPLQKSFRFGPAIAEEANRILTLLGSELRVEGHEPVGSKLAVLEHPDVVLTRTNAAAVGRLMEAQVAGLRGALVGGTAQVEALARAAQDLSQGRKTEHPDLLAFESWQQVQNYVDEDDDAKELAVLVRLVDSYGADALLDAVRRAVPEVDAQLVISTAHKSKGREWDAVKLDTDFPVPLNENTGDFRADEARLAYVAVTRAKRYLDSESLEWVDMMARKLGQERIFAELSPEEAPVSPEERGLPADDGAQLIPDPEDARRLMFRRTKYDPDLVDAQRGLPGRRYHAEYCSEEKVNVVQATRAAIEVAERFSLTIADSARARVLELAPEPPPAAAATEELRAARE